VIDLVSSLADVLQIAHDFGPPHPEPVPVKESGGGANAIACGGACTALLARGATPTLAASAAAGSAFVEWGGPCSGAAACTLTMSDAQNVSARFELLRRVTVTRSGTGAGSVSGPGGIACGATCAASFPNGASLSVSAQAEQGSRFEGWGGACAGAEACVLAVDGDKAVTATFADVAAPTARALSSSGKRGRPVRLRFRVDDNADDVRVEVKVFRGRRRLATLRGNVDADGGVRSRTWRVPRRFAGKGRFCVAATDAAGNRSAQSCAPLRVR